MDDAGAVFGLFFFLVVLEAGAVQAVKDELEVFVCVLLLVAGETALTFPAALEQGDGAVAFGFFRAMEFREDVVEGARGAGFPLAVHAAVAHGEVVGSDEGVVDQ